MNTNANNDMIPFNGLRGVCAMAILLGHQTDLFVGRRNVVIGDDSSDGISDTFNDQSIGLEYLQAVSLFFLLSGIPLARLYGGATGKVDTRRGAIVFWKKRAARLAPVYYLALVLNLVVVFVVCRRADIGATLASFVGCAFLLQPWNIAWIDVGGVLWQVAVFAYGYAAFPIVSQHIITGWTEIKLWTGIVVLWVFSAALWAAPCWLLYRSSSPSSSSSSSLEQVFDWSMLWHVHGISRLPHIVAGVLLGQWVEQQTKKKQQQQHETNTNHWPLVADVLSFILLLTAIQSPIVQHYYGTEMRMIVSVALQALLMPLHAVWLAAIVLAYNDKSNDNEQRQTTTCWTRQFLSLQPLVALGDVSLVLYCLHIDVMFFYSAVYAYMTSTDHDWHLADQDYGTLQVQVPFFWHAPVQWALVLLVSFAVSHYFEAPLRKMMVARMTTATTPQQRTAPDGEGARLLGLPGSSSSGHRQMYNAA